MFFLLCQWGTKVFSAYFANKKEGAALAAPGTSSYLITWIQPSGASMRPIWIPVKVS